MLIEFYIWYHTHAGEHEQLASLRITIGCLRASTGPWTAGQPGRLADGYGAAGAPVTDALRRHINGRIGPHRAGG
eukprot:5442376-Pyramimonas_sp.AAC.1